MKKQLPSAPRQRRTGAYACALARQPLAWGSALAIALTGAATSAIIAGPAMLALMAVTCVAASRPAVRRYVDTRQHHERLRQRREEREARLEEARASRDGLGFLTQLADHVARWDPARAELLDLEDLLDRYTDAAIALACRRHALAAVDVGRLQRLRASLAAESPRATLVARRLTCWAACQDRCRELEEELATIHELFALAAQQALAGAGEPDAEDAGVEERLARLDALEP